SRRAPPSWRRAPRHAPRRGPRRPGARRRRRRGRPPRRAPPRDSRPKAGARAGSVESWGASWSALLERDRHAHLAGDALAALHAGVELPLLQRVERRLLERRMARLRDLRALHLAVLADHEDGRHRAVDLLAAHLGRVERLALEDRTRLLVDLSEAERLLHLVVERARLAGAADA